MDTDDVQGAQAAPQLEEQIPAAEQLPEATPTSDQQPTEQVTPELDEEKLALESSKNPERTKAYIEKLKAELAQAKATPKPDLPQEDVGNSVFDSFRPQTQTGDYGYLNQNQVSTIANQFVDAEGNVDINGFNQAIQEANQRAQLAERRAQEASERVARFEETQQVKEAHTVFPQLDPKSKEFDKAFFDLTRDRVLRNMYEGKQQSLLEVANDINSKYQKPTPVNVAKVKEEAVAEFKQTQELRNQGPIEPGRGEPRQTTTNLDELRERTRMGDQDALEERLKAVTS